MAWKTCNECGSHVLQCDRCSAPMVRYNEPFLLPNPFGSLNAAAPVQVCVRCYIEYAKEGFRFIGIEPPDNLLSELRRER